MKKILAVLAVLTMMAGNVWAQEQVRGEQENDQKTSEERKDCFLGQCIFEFDPNFGVGLGATRDSHYGNGNAHLGAWATLLSRGSDNNGYIHLMGIGLVLDLYDFANHPSEVRDISRSDSGVYATLVWTFVPVQVGPFAYQFSLSNNVHSFGLNRGRLHMLTLDFTYFTSGF